MGGRHSAKRMDMPGKLQSSPKSDGGQCLTQASESESTVREPLHDRKLYRIRQASTRVTPLTLSDVPATRKSEETAVYHTQDIDVKDVKKRLRRRSLLDVKLESPRQSLPPLHPTPPLAPGSTTHKKVPKLKRPHQFISPTHMLLARQMEAQHELPPVEFEEEASTPTFFRTVNETHQASNPPAAQSTYRIAKPRPLAESTLIPEVESKRETGIIGLLKEAAAVKYEAPRREGAHTVHELIGKTPATLSTPALSAAIFDGFGTVADRELSQAARYKIKSLINLKPPSPQIPSTPKTPARIWKGSRGSLLVPNNAVRQ